MTVPPQESSSPSDAPPETARKPAIVVADDNARFRLGLVRALVRRGDLSVVAEAGDGMEAFAAITRYRPDIAVVDLRMPRVGGLDILRLVAADPVLRGTPVVVLSATPRDEMVQTALRAGAARVIDKTCSRQEIGDQLLALARGLPTIPRLGERP